MPSLEELKSGHWSAKGLWVSFILVIVGGLMVFSGMRKGVDLDRTGTVMLMCVADGCGYTQTVPEEQFQQMRRERQQQWEEETGQTYVSPKGDGFGTGSAETLAPWGTSEQWPLVCPQCGGQTLFIAKPCEECGKFFVPGMSGMDYDDQCPYCKYSEQKAIQDAYQADRDKAKERKRR